MHASRSLSPFSGAWCPRISLHPFPAPVFDGSQRPLAIPVGERLFRGGAWYSQDGTGSSQSLPSTGLVLLFLLFFYLCYLSYCFPFWETIVFEIVLVSLFHAILFSYSNSFFTVPTIFWWLLQVSSGDVVGLALICFPFTFETALCSPLK